MRRNLLFPKSPAEAKYYEVIKTLKKHYVPKRSVVVDRYKLYRRKQGKGKTVNNSVVEMKELAAPCAFEAFLDQALRDRLIAGLQNDAIRCNLLATEGGNDLTFDQA